MSQWPSSIGFRAYAPRLINRLLGSTAISGARDSRKIAELSWGFAIEYHELDESDWLPIQAFIVGLEGADFTIALPGITNTKGTPSGTVTANGAAAIGASALNITGLTGVLKAGQFFTFAGHTRMYMATADRSGNGSLSFKPHLVEAVANGEAINYTNPVFTARLPEPVQTWNLGNNELYTYQLDMVEVI